MPTILCIDDHAPTLQTLRWLFEANGYKCVTTPRGEEGLELLTGNSIDLIVLDHILCEGEGAVLAKSLKKIRDIPILMLSGWADLQKPSCVDVLMIKPQDPKVLLATVLSLLVKYQTAAK